VVYYAFFDTAVNQVLIEDGALDIAASPVIGLVVETDVDVDEVALRRGFVVVAAEQPDLVAHARPAAMRHVYVDRATQRPVELPDALRAVLDPLLVGPA
jgi:acyl-CoA thioester hydrolase